MKKIMRTGIAVGIAVISVQIVNPVYAEESETQNINYTAEVNSDEFVTESDQSSEKIRVLKMFRVSMIVRKMRI